MLPVCLLLLQAAGPPDAQTLVRSMAEFYFTLEAYSVEIRQEFITIGQTRPGRRLRLDRGPHGETRLEMLKPSRLLQTTDGAVAFQYNAAAGQYRQEEHGGPITRAISEGAGGFVRRFEKLAALTGQARFLRWDAVKEQGRRVRCALIEVRSEAASRQGWVEKLCIEPDSTLVLRSELRWTGVPSRSTGLGDASLPSSRPGSMSPAFGGVQPDGGTQVTQYRWLSVGSVAPGVSFRFDPPVGARRID